MNTVLLTRRYLGEYVRNPVNLLLLTIVPVVFVALAAGTIAEFSKLLGGTGSAAAIQENTAGWAAAFLAGIAMFFQEVVPVYSRQRPGRPDVRDGWRAAGSTPGPDWRALPALLPPVH